MASSSSVSAGIQAHAWLASHGKQAAAFEGQWVAVVTGRIVAAARTLRELLKNPGVQRVRDKALFTQIPTREDSFLAPRA